MRTVIPAEAPSNRGLSKVAGIHNGPPIKAFGGDKLKVLITCGPTWVAIDDVRVISNRSTGEMGHLIAQEFKKAGADVTVIEGPVTDGLKVKGIKVIKYNFFDELAVALKTQLLRKFDIVVHAAAVSDFKPAHAIKTKISSSKNITLKLISTEKLINHFKVLAPETFVVGFKLEPKLNAQKAGRLSRRLIIEAKCELVVANSIDHGYQGFIIDGDGEVLAKAATKRALAQHLVRIVQ